MALDLATNAERMLDHFAETVTYRPASGDPRSIKAIVNRMQRQETFGSRESNVPMAEVQVLNRATAVADDTYGGIELATLDTGGDRIRMPLRIGGEVSDRQIVRVVRDQTDDAVLTLEVR